MTNEQFIALARELKELGATSVSAEGYAVTFALPPPPQRVLVAPAPKEVRPPQDTQEDTPAGRQAYRDHVRRTLANE